MDINSWIKYSKNAWDSAGRPKGLDPYSIIKDPISYDTHFYQYFERRYFDMWHGIFARINPVNGTYFRRESKNFKVLWERNFSWETIWKQTLPLLVYGTTLSVRNEILIELASWYSLGQAIPSVVIDRILDENTDKQFNSDTVFCIQAYEKGLQGLRSLKLPCNQKLEDIFLSLTGEMYDKMLDDYSHYFKWPKRHLSDEINSYMSHQSRLLSSVFFGILPAWAYALTDKIPSDKLTKSTIALRKVRQLNDEILDVDSDICHGQISLPWLFALEEKATLKRKIEILWKDTSSSEALFECKQIFQKTTAMERASDQSKLYLLESMEASTEIFSDSIIFDITLLHNVRWCLLSWLKNVNYDRHIETIRKPNNPEAIILDTIKPIEPIPGGGVLVMNKNQEILMSLVLKRGMLRWELPAGVAKKGEALEETAKRETFEEAGRNVIIGKQVATCWHYSRKLNKGWMGIIFLGEIIDNSAENNILVISDKALPNSKFNPGISPKLYDSIKLDQCDFESLLDLCKTQFNFSPSHESIVASGFINWRKIPVGRIHPLHRQLLETYNNGEQYTELLVSDADKDFESYDTNSKLYYNS